MYILMIARGYPTKRYPQWGCFEQDQAEALVAYGHKVVMVSVDSRFCRHWRKIGITHLLRNGVEIYNSFFIPGSFIRWFSTRLSRKIRSIQLRILYELIEKKHGIPDVLFGQFFFNTALAVNIQKEFNIPLVGIEHAGRFNNDILDRYTKDYATLAYENADGIVTVSETLRMRLKYHFGKDSTVVHNLIGSDFRHMGNEDKRRRRNSGFHFVSTGTLTYCKGYDLLIKAFVIAGLRTEKVQITIIGDGEERSKLQRQIIEAGLEKNIFLVGRKTKPEVAAILGCCDAFILPSRGENFSVAVLEALAMGLPVIATLCGGIRECLDESNGMLVPVEDVDELAFVMRRMYENIESYDRFAIADGCRRRFSPPVIARELTQVFEETISKCKSSVW